MIETSLTNLVNIGDTLASKLNEVGIQSSSDLVKVGSIETFKLLSKANPEKTLPLCYYLYSLEGAIHGKDWRDLSESKKRELRLKVGLK